MSAAEAKRQFEPVIGKYRPILELGRGGMANVFLCILEGIGGFSKLQVVKRLRPEFAKEPDFRDMFLEEARLAARINHRNVVQTNEVGVDGSNLFIAMEYLEGESYEEMIRRAAKTGKPLSLGAHATILIDTLRGLHFAHELKDFQGRPLDVIHRDVSPQNIFITYDGEVKLVDFGIAKAADSHHETRTGVLKGKVPYMAPEQIMSRGGTVDRRADLFAVGTILWRAITGKRLWRGMTDVEILLKVTMGEIPSPATENPKADPAIVAICMKALATKVEDRFQTAQEMIEALESYVAVRPDERVGSRQIGQYLSSLSGERKKEIADAIQGLIADASLTPPNWHRIPSLPPSSAPSVASNLHKRGTDPDDETLAAHVEPTEPPGTHGTLTFDAPTGRPRMKRVLFIAAAALVVAVGGAALAWRAHDSTVAAPLPPATQTQPPRPVPTTVGTPVEQVQFRTQLSPANASIFVDDQLLTPNTHFDRDGIVHRVTASADRYESQSRLITFDQPTIDVVFDLHGAALPTRAPGVGTRALPSASVSAAATGDPPMVPAPLPSAVDPKKKVGIDKSDPWVPGK